MIHFKKTPYSVRLLLTDKCNLNCSICLRDASNKNSKEELNTEEWLKFFERLKDLRVFNISLSGGEIFLKNDLFVLLKKLRENRMHRITLLTNGTLISEEIANQLNEINIKLVSISVDGLEEKHDQIRGAGAFQKTIRGIQCLLAAGIRPTISFTPTRDNYKDIRPLIDLMVSLGILAIQVNTLSPEGRCLNIYKNIELEYPQQVKEFIDIIIEKQREFPNIKIKCQLGFYYYLPKLYKEFQKNSQNYKMQYLKSGCGAASLDILYNHPQWRCCSL